MHARNARPPYVGTSHWRAARSFRRQTSTGRSLQKLRSNRNTNVGWTHLGVVWGGDRPGLFGAEGPATADALEHGRQLGVLHLHSPQCVERGINPLGIGPTRHLLLRLSACAAGVHRARACVRVCVRACVRRKICQHGCARVLNEEPDAHGSRKMASVMQWPFEPCSQREMACATSVSGRHGRKR